MFFRKKYSGVAGLILVNDFSGPARKRNNRITLISRQMRESGIKKVLLTTSYGSYIDQLPVLPDAERTSIEDFCRKYNGPVVLAMDWNIHLSAARIKRFLSASSSSGKHVLPMAVDGRIQPFGVQDGLIALRPGINSSLAGYLSNCGSNYIEQFRSEFLDNESFIELEHSREDFFAGYALMADMHLPRTIQLETSTRCNNSCLMCPYHGVRQSSGSRYIRPEEEKDMPLEVFERTVREIAKWDDPYHNTLSRTVVPYWRGELFYNLDYERILRVIKENGLACFFATNATAMDEKASRVLIDLEVDHLKISMHGASPEVYKTITGRDIGNIESNVRRLIEMRNSLGKKNPQVGVIFTVQDSNKHETDVYLDQWLKIVDYVALSPENRMDEQVHSKKYQTDLCFFEPERSLRLPCNLITECAWVQASGDVMPCNGGVPGYIGNITDSPLQEILRQNDTLKNLWTAHSSGRFNDIASCRECQCWFAHVLRIEDTPRYESIVSPVMKLCYPYKGTQAQDNRV